MTVNAVADIVNDNATTNEDTPVNILVLGNDTFEDAGRQITGTTNGTHGTVTINDNGTAGNPPTISSSTRPTPTSTAPTPSPIR